VALFFHNIPISLTPIAFVSSAQDICANVSLKMLQRSGAVRDASIHRKGPILPYLAEKTGKFRPPRPIKRAATCAPILVNRVHFDCGSQQLNNI